MMIAISSSGCTGPTPVVPTQKPEARIEIRSEAFREGGSIPSKYTCDGEKISPQLSWTEIPENAASLALIMDDPDAPAGTFTHWVVFNIDPALSGFPEGFSPENSSPGRNVQGKNSFGMVGYGPPCPPKGSTHRYFFRLFALDQSIDLSAGSDRTDVEKQMSGSILASGEIFGTYGH